VFGPKLAQRDGLGALLARVSGTSRPFRTVSVGYSANFALKAFYEVRSPLGFVTLVVTLGRRWCYRVVL